MNKVICSFGILLVLACSSPEPENAGDAKIEIAAIMANQQDSWNAGNLEAFMEPYWHHDSLLFIGSRGPTYGWKTTLENYKKSYPTKDEMGTLQFDNFRFKPLENDHYWVAGKWTLFRASDTLSGHYTLVWKRLDSGWKIISDHSS